MEVLIDEQNLIDIAGALRGKYGDTEIVEAPVIDAVVSRTPDTTWFDTGKYVNNMDLYDVVTIPGASKILVDMAYQTFDSSGGIENGYTDYVSVLPGNLASMPEDTIRYGGGSSEGRINRVELTFEGTDTVTFHFASDESFCMGIGYFATCTGYDSDGNVVPLGKTYSVEIEVERTYKPREMSVAIDGLNTIPGGNIIVTGICQYRFAYNGWNWVIDSFGDSIKTREITNATWMFGNSTELKNIPFEINFTDGGGDCNSMFVTCIGLIAIPSIDFRQTTIYRSCDSLFTDCRKVTSIGTLKNLYPQGMSGMFKGLWLLRELPKIEGLNLSRIYEYNYANVTSLFENCYSLRAIPEEFLNVIYMPMCTASYYSHLTKTFTKCYALDEIRGINPKTGAMTSNVFASGSGATFAYCGRVKDIVFATQDDGSPYVCNWKNQMIELNTCVGYVDFPLSVLDYNSGITSDKEVKDDATYQALKNDPDWWTVEPVYSRYNRLSAVNTINSLPDVSQGSGNTIKFRGVDGSKTDGGAINTMSAEEIAVATAKGWTVTFV